MSPGDEGSLHHATLYSEHHLEGQLRGELGLPVAPVSLMNSGTARGFQSSRYSGHGWLALAPTGFWVHLALVGVSA